MTPRASGFPALRRALGHAKFAQPRLVALVLDSGYHLQQECVSGLRQLGHTVHRCHFQPTEAPHVVVQRVLASLVEARPDFLLCINHLGFDQDGVLANALEHAGMPVAVWYVDSPAFVLLGAPLPAPKVSTVFLWDASWRSYCEDIGATAVHHLPLACDPLRLGLPIESSGQPRPLTVTVAGRRADLFYVGDSMTRLERYWSDQLEASERQPCQDAASTLVAGANTCVELPTLLLATSDDRRALVWAAATAKATASLRQRWLGEQVPQDRLAIMGDQAWAAIANQAWHLPSVPYGAQLTPWYQNATVVLGQTSAQMPTGVNQRVFDVPVCGGLLLTDRQEELEDLFDLHDEVLTYNRYDPESLVHDGLDRVAFLERHPEARQKHILKARQRVLSEHTYEHRLQSMIGVLRRRWGPHRVGKVKRAG